MDTERVIQVLLVDDDEYHAFLVEEYLKESHGARFILEWANTYDKGLTAIKERRHDVVLLDYYLGKATGIDLLEAFPSLTFQVPVILLTGHADERIDSEALRRGAFDFLDKNDLNGAVLERTIRYAVRHFSVQQALRESKERFEGLYHSVFEGILVHDGERVLHANPSLLRMLGRSQEDIAGASLSAVFNGALAPMLGATVHEGAAATELELRANGNEPLLVEVRARPHVFNGRDAYLLAVRDVTELKRHQAELQRMNEELEGRVEQRTEALRRSNRDLEHFAHVIAHDIRAPLSAVGHHLQEARLDCAQTAESGEAQLQSHFLDKAVATVERLQGLIDAVLEYSRISTRDRTMLPVDLNGVMQDALLCLDSQLKEADATVIAPRLPVVQGDPILLVNLFLNLLQNALKYRGEVSPQVNVSVRERGAFWQLQVSDNGIGFRGEEAHDIFIVLHRGENSTAYPGTGLGLATCKKIVELHGGRIWAESTPGQGATFFFTLPKTEVR